MSTNYRARLSPFPVDVSVTKNLYTADAYKVCTGYLRVVIGQRGPYVECAKQQLVWDHLCVRPTDRWRWHSRTAYYVELTDVETSTLKVYLQRRTVTYADYKPGLYYISPFDLYYVTSTAINTFGIQVPEYRPMILPLRRSRRHKSTTNVNEV